LLMSELLESCRLLIKGTALEGKMDDGWAAQCTYPARSTRCSFDRLMVADPASRDVMWMVKMQWDRVDAWFMGVWTHTRYNICVRLYIKVIHHFSHTGISRNCI